MTRFRLRYSLRGLLIAVTLACLLAGWFAVRTQHAKQQAAAVQALQEGVVSVAYDYMLNSRDEPTGSDQPPPGMLRKCFSNDFISNVVQADYPAGPLPKCRLLPLADVWGLRHLSLRGTATEDDDVQMKDLRSLQTLDLAFTDVTDAVVHKLTSLSRLSLLDLSGTSVSDAAIEDLRNCPRQRQLILDDSLVSGDSIQHLSSNRPSLKVDWSKAPSQEHQDAERALARLGASISNTEKEDFLAIDGEYFVPGRYVAVVANQDIWNHWKGKEDDLRRISQIEGITTLILTDLTITEELWQTLSKLPALQSLQLNDVKTTGLGGLTRLGRIRHLSLSHCPVADHDLPAISALSELESLSLQQTGISDKSLSALTTLQKLVRIDVSQNQITDAGVSSLVQLEKLQTVNFYETQISDQGLTELAHRKTLRQVELNMTPVTDRGLTQLAKLEDLEELDLSLTKITDAGLAELRGLQHLKVLRLCGTNISDRGLEDVAKLKSLQDLWIVVDGTHVTESGIGRLQRALPHLKITRI